MGRVGITTVLGIKGMTLKKKKKKRLKTADYKLLGNVVGVLLMSAFLQGASNRDLHPHLYPLVVLAFLKLPECSEV